MVSIEREDQSRYELKSREVAKIILSELQATFGYRTASLQLVQGDARTMLAGCGFEDESISQDPLRLVSTDPLICRIVATREPVILGDVSQDPDWSPSPRAHHVKSWIGLPVIHEQKVIALLTLDHDEPGFYTQAIEDHLVSFARTVAPRIVHARLWDSAQRQSRNIEILNEILRVTSAKLGTEDLLSTIAAQIAERLDCSTCTIFFPEEVGGDVRLLPRATHGERTRTMTRSFKLGEGLVGQVFSEGSSLVLADACRDPRFAPPREERNQPRSMLVVPVRVGEQTIGVISADQDEFGWFTESDRQLVEVLGQHLGIAIQRSIGLTLLQDIGNRIVSLESVGDILREVVSGAVRLTNAASGVIFLLTEDGRSVREAFQLAGFSHPPPRLADGDGLTRTVVRTSEVLCIPDITVDARVNPALNQVFRSMIAIPIKGGGKVIGVLYVHDVAPHHFTETEISLLVNLGIQAAIAIQVAKLVHRGIAASQCWGGRCHPRNPTTVRLAQRPVWEAASSTYGRQGGD